MKTRLANLPTLRRWLLEAEYDPVLKLASREKRIFSLLTALAYNMDASVSKHAIAATGPVAKIIAKREPEYVRNYLLRLFWLVNDESGSICWRTPGLIEEIMYNCPTFDQFSLC